jgi:hypothetical protein
VAIPRRGSAQRTGAGLCRPAEVVTRILGDPDIGEFGKADGEVVPARSRT